MKLTWFGGTTLRVHIGGHVLVCHPDGAPAGIDRTELAADADRVVTLTGGDLPAVDLALWQPRRVRALVEEADSPELSVSRIGSRSLLIEASGEPPLLLLGDPVEAPRWRHGGVAVAFGVEPARAALDTFAPVLLALAVEEAALDAAFAALSALAGNTVVIALEPGLAVEA